MNKSDDTISRQDAIRWVKTECNPYGKPTLDFESGKRVIEHLEQMPSAEPKTGEWISEELANMICNEICYYKEVTVDADSLNDLCEGCLIKKMKYGRPTGEWVKVIDEETPNVTKWHYECDQCGAGRLENGQRYCTRCGAKMGREDGEA